MLLLVPEAWRVTVRDNHGPPRPSDGGPESSWRRDCDLGVPALRIGRNDCRIMLGDNVGQRHHCRTSCRLSRSARPHAEMPARLAGYLALTDWTGRIARPDKRGVLAGVAPTVLGELGIPEDQWHRQATGIEQRYWGAVGAVDEPMNKRVR